MFFPCLENLKKEKFHEQSIKLFDWWLGTRRKNTLRNLNPLQFSLDCDIDVSHSLKLFSQGVYNSQINLLKKNYSLVCPLCVHKIFFNKETFENVDYKCRNCGEVISKNLIRDEIIINFELLQSPQDYLSDVGIGVKRGNASSLRMSELKKYEEDDDIRRLFNDL